MTPESPDPLKSRILRLCGDLEAKALETQNAAPSLKPDVETLSCLLAIYKAREELKAPPNRLRLLALLLAISVALIGAMYSIKLPSMKIDAQLDASEFEVELAAGYRLNLSLPLRAAAFSGFRNATIPDERSALESLLNDPSVYIVAPLEGKIGLGDFTIPKGARLRFARVGGGNRTKVVLSLPAPAKTRLPATVRGPASIDIDGRKRVLQKGAALIASFETGTGDASFEFECPDSAVATFAERLPVGKLSAFRLLQRYNASDAEVTREATLNGGTIYFESMANAEHKVRRGEAIEFGEPSGEIVSVSHGKMGLDVRFIGSVKSLGTGEGPSRRELMPNLLDWIRVSHGVTLFWGSSVYFFTWALGFLRGIGLKNV